MGNNVKQRVPVILKGSGQIVGYYSGKIPERELVLRWSLPDDPDFGIEALILRDLDSPNAVSPYSCPVKAIMVASVNSLTEVRGFTPADNV